MTTALTPILLKILKYWRDCWRSLEGPELEPRLWHSHFLTAHHAEKSLLRLGSYLQGKTIDIGAGTGQGARYINPAKTDYFPTDLPTGRSTSDPSISLRAHKPIVHCSIYDLPFAAESFEAALLLNVLEHLSAPSVGLAEVERILKPGGSLLFCVPFAFPLHGLPDDYRRWTSQGLRHELESAGFELCELCTCGTTFSSLAVNINLCLRYEVQPLVLLTPFLIVIQGILNAMALLAERFLPSARALPLLYVGLARKKTA